MNFNDIEAIAKQSSMAAQELASTSESMRNLALTNMADALESVKQQVFDINAQEVLKARQEQHQSRWFKSVQKICSARCYRYYL